MSDVTRILETLQHGAPGAAEMLLPMVYEELRNLARQKMASEPPGQTLQATALVHEAYLRLVKENGHPWRNRGHFFAVAAEVMRRILVDRARRRRSHKHGGQHERVDWDAIEISVAGDDDLILRVHEALEQFEVEEPEKAAVVKLRFFAGLNNREAGEILNISEKTVTRHWTFAKARLYQLMREEM